MSNINFLLKRTATAEKRPTAAQLSVGELALNYAADSPGLFLEDNSGAVRKVGPTHVGGTAPNASPAGQAGNSTGELWLDTSQTPDELKVWNGSSWISVNAVVSGTATLLDGPVSFEAQATVDLSFGDVVYITGASGDTPTVGKAQANSSTTMPAYGFASADITSGNTGNIITFGSIEGDGSTPLDTSGLSVNDVVWVSPTTAGAWTTTKPTGEGNLLQNIGRIQRINSQNGVIKVGGAGRTNATPNLNDGNIFIGDSNNEATTQSLSTAISARLGLTRTSGTGTNIEIDTAAIGFKKDLAFDQASDITFIDNTSEALQLADILGTPYITFDSTDDAECVKVHKKLCLDADTQVDLSGSTVLTLLDNDFDALDIKEGNNLYIRINTTDSGEKIQIQKDIWLAAELHMANYLLMDNEKDIRFREKNTNGTNYLAIKAPTSLTATTTLTLPDGDGSANQSIRTDGSGNLSWANTPTALFGINAHASWDGSAGGSFNWSTDKISEGNITSVTRTAEGKFTVTFDSDFDSANYTAICTAGALDHTGITAGGRTVAVTSRSAGSMDLVVERADDGANDDSALISIMVIGTLA